MIIIDQQVKHNAHMDHALRVQTGGEMACASDLTGR
jgi:hypothetical protein